MLSSRKRCAMSDVIFVTVCGGRSQAEVDAEYGCLFGSMEHHAKWGRHLVLDTAPVEFRGCFTKLPPGVRWLQNSTYGHGGQRGNGFRMHSALSQAVTAAEHMAGAGVLVHLDCDEFYEPARFDEMVQKARDGNVVEVLTMEWRQRLDLVYSAFNYESWHRRAWPAGRGVRIMLNEAWVSHPWYDGNPERHPFPMPGAGMGLVRVRELHHHIGQTIRAKNEVRGKGEIPLRVDEEASKAVWPEALLAWRDGGPHPMSRYV